jgi:NAD(P)H-hydrate epimerase
VEQFFPAPGTCVVVFGKGHNGGDALVAARHLRDAGWQIELRPAFPASTWADLTRVQHERVDPLERSANKPARRVPLIVLDGLLGIGAGGPLREPILGACREINRLRLEENAQVFALDLPTGLNGDTGEVAEGAVIADLTLTIGFAKIGLLADGAINHVGRLALLPLNELSARADSVSSAADAVVATGHELRGVVPRRAFDTHKGKAGRVAILAGSVGTIGAAAMCAEGAVRGGAGLVNLFVPAEVYEVAAMRTIPEVMVRKFESVSELIDGNWQALALGPGSGRKLEREILQLIVHAPQPMVIDADGLNCLASDVTVIDDACGPRLLTPHPGEMARLDPDSTRRSRAETVEHFVRRWPHTLLLKGARSVIGQRGKPLSYNSTGHPGLATGGVGDVMTGVLTALIGQGVECYDAARAGSWLIGRAAERAIFQGGHSAESLSATSLFSPLGAAFEDLRDGAC